MLSKKTAEYPIFKVINYHSPLYSNLYFKNNLRNRIMSRNFTRWIMKNDPNKQKIENNVNQPDWNKLFKMRLIRTIRRFIQIIRNFIRKIAINTISIITSFVIIRDILPNTNVFNKQNEDIIDNMSYYLEESIDNFKKSKDMMQYLKYFAYGCSCFMSMLLLMIYYNY